MLRGNLPYKIRRKWCGILERRDGQDHQYTISSERLLWPRFKCDMVAFRKPMRFLSTWDLRNLFSPNLHNCSVGKGMNINILYRGMPLFIVLCSTVLHRYCVFHKLKVSDNHFMSLSHLGSSHNTNFRVIIIWLWQSMISDLQYYYCNSLKAQMMGSMFQQ